MMKNVKVQTNLFGEKIVEEYEGLNAWGETINIPNFKPVSEDENPRLDYKKQYSILVHLDTEEQQNLLYNILKEKGLKCKKN